MTGLTKDRSSLVGVFSNVAIRLFKNVVQYASNPPKVALLGGSGPDMTTFFGDNLIMSM